MRAHTAGADLSQWGNVGRRLACWCVYMNTFVCGGGVFVGVFAGVRGVSDNNILIHLHLLGEIVNRTLLAPARGSAADEIN